MWLLAAAILLDVVSAQWGGNESGFAPGWNGSEPIHRPRAGTQSLWRSGCVHGTSNTVHVRGAVARKPVLGWRSWNCFGAGVSDALMRDAIDAITTKNWTVDGETVSLADVGYASVGIDEGWEGCGQGVTVKGRKTQHYANGTPAINEKFPDMVRSQGTDQQYYVC